VPSAGGDGPLSVDDTTTHTWYSFGGFQWTGPNSALASQGSGESDTGSGIEVANSNWDEGVGTLRQSDVARGSVNHMLRVEMSADMLASYTSDTNQLAPYAWPQISEDGFAVSGSGGTAYSGTVPYGVTIGIPALAQEPAAVAANPGADLLWKALQDHGAMIRDSGGSGNTVIFQADQDVSPGDPVIQGMQQLGQQVMQYAMILTNQGPDSINGGGTPIIPMDGPGAVMIAGNIAMGLCSTPGNVATNLTVDQLAMAASTNTPLPAQAATPAAPGPAGNAAASSTSPAAIAPVTLNLDSSVMPATPTTPTGTPGSAVAAAPSSTPAHPAATAATQARQSQAADNLQQADQIAATVNMPQDQQQTQSLIDQAQAAMNAANAGNPAAALP
jgi:hypothetical protein